MKWIGALKHSSMAVFAMVLMVALGGCSDKGPVAAPESRSLTSAASQSLVKRALTGAEKYEVRFMQDMIDHHAIAIMMAQMCQERAIHDELREMCHEIEVAQAAEIEQMQTWLLQWYGVSYEPEVEDSGQMDKLADESGAAFEITFMEMMIKHHEKAVREGEKCVKRAIHEELVALCRNIVATQSVEIEQMQAWLCSWYAECR